MIQTVLQSVVMTVGAAMLTTHPAPMPQTPIQVSTERMYVVSEGESLSEIAQTTYNNKDAWTVILKNNPQIVNPDVVEEGTVLKMPITPPTADEVASASGTPKAMHDGIALSAPVVTAAPTQPIQQAQVLPATNGVLTEAQLTALGSCEAGMDPAKNTGNGYYGAFQFSYGTWKSLDTGYERADLAPIEVQKAAVQKLLSRSSIFHQFPACARKMRAEGIL